MTTVPAARDKALRKWCLPTSTARIPQECIELAEPNSLSLSLLQESLRNVGFTSVTYNTEGPPRGRWEWLLGTHYLSPFLPSLIGSHAIGELNISLRGGLDWWKRHPFPRGLINGSMTQFWPVKPKERFTVSFQESSLLPPL